MDEVKTTQNKIRYKLERQMPQDVNYIFAKIKLELYLAF